MIKSLRKFVLVVAAAIFLLSTANVFLYLHLAEHEHDAGGHDHKHCPICQQASINKNEAVIPSASITFELPRIIIAQICVTEHIIKNFSSLLPYLRAPPALS